MKKHQLLLYVSFFSLPLAMRAQEETPAPPVQDSPLIEFVKNKESIIDFNKLDNFSNYGNTEERDLNRQTPLEYIHLALSSPGIENDINYDLPADILSVDNIDYDLSGYNKIRLLGEKTIVLGTDTVENSSLLQITEIYSVKKGVDEITRYENTYYSFVKDSSVVMEVFHKERLWSGGLSQIFEGVSINTVGQHSSIQIVLTPNPALTDCTAQFSLYESGEVTLRIINQNATMNKKVFSGNLSSGSQSIPFSVEDFVPGIYTISLEFDNNFYSSNLIIN